MNKTDLENNKVAMSHPVKIDFTEGQKISDIITSYKIRIMYKNQNRNGSYIPESTANKMAASIGGVPIVGIFDEEKGDFKGHEDLKITTTEDGSKDIELIKPDAYGFIPPNAECTWEDHVDDDGETRRYLTTVGYLWTGRYDELSTLKDGQNNQSMELNPDTAEFSIVEIEDGEWVFAITDAELIGLCILGKDVEPCFEGAAFEPMFTKETTQFAEVLKEMTEELRVALDEYEESEPEVDDEGNPIEPETDEEEEKGADGNPEGDEEEPEEETDDDLEPTPEDLAKIEAEGTPDDEDIDDIDSNIDNVTQEEYTKLITELASTKAALETANAELSSYKAKETKEQKMEILEKFQEEMFEEDYEELLSKIDEMALENIEIQAERFAYKYAKAQLAKYSKTEPNTNKSNENFTFTDKSSNLNSDNLSEWQRRALEKEKELKGQI